MHFGTEITITQFYVFVWADYEKEVRFPQTFCYATFRLGGSIHI